MIADSDLWGLPAKAKMKLIIKQVCHNLLNNELLTLMQNSGCKNSILLHSESEIPFDKIEKCKTIGISSGASAPEVLVEKFLNEIKKKYNISVEEVEIVKEDVTFKIPGKLN